MGGHLISYILDNLEKIEQMYKSGASVKQIIKELGLERRRPEYVYYVLCLRGLRRCRGNLSSEHLEEIAMLRRLMKTAKEISEILNIDLTFVRLALYLLGMSRSDIRKRAINFVKKMYLDGVSLAKISRTLGISIPTIIQWLKREGIYKAKKRGRSSRLSSMLSKIAEEIKAKIMERGVYTRSDFRREYPEYAYHSFRILQMLSNNKDIFLIRFRWLSTNISSVMPVKYFGEWILYREKYEKNVAKVIASMITHRDSKKAITTVLKHNNVPDSIIREVHKLLSSQRRSPSEKCY